MPKPSAFVDHVVDLLRIFGAVTPKAMFGGWGLYREGIFFALIAEDTLYLKCDDGNAGEFDALALAPFIYQSKVDERIVTSYRRAPDEALEDADVMARWARLGYEAALRAKQATRRPPRRVPVPRS